MNQQNKIETMNKMKLALLLFLFFLFLGIVGVSATRAIFSDQDKIKNNEITTGTW